MTNGTVQVNGRTYAWPREPIVGVCIDGSQPAHDDEPGYIEEAVRAGVAPYFKNVLENGTNRLGDGVVPSFTNPNNLSIATGQPPSVHGINGNFFLDVDSNTEIMMNDPELLRAKTIFAEFQRCGAKVCVITAKDKLRRLLGHGLSHGKGGAINFSAEKADEASNPENGIAGVIPFVGKPVPKIYSAELSEFVFAAGLKIMERDRPDLMYLSTSDYIQHKHAPGTPVANAFYQMIDGYLAALDKRGCTIVITADHGMNAKHDNNGLPSVLYLQDLFDKKLGEGEARVILPISDPYVAHHGTFGSFATAYLLGNANRDLVIDALQSMDQIELATGREAAAERFELPADRLGDIVVISTKNIVLGTSEDRHDLTALTEPLRSHGGISEQKVPFLMNRRIDIQSDRPLRNFDIYHAALNHAVRWPRLFGQPDG